MLAEIESLLVIQDRDQRILKLEADLKRIPADQERAKERLAKDIASVATSKSAVQDNEVAIKNVELDIGTRKATLVRLKTQQYETKKNEEFTALGNEIVRYEQQIDDYETTELELMEKADELRALQKKAEDALTVTQARVDEEIVNLGKQLEQCIKHLDEVKAERMKLAANIDEDELSLYERLMVSKGGDAIVSAGKGQCSGCHMKLVPATMISVQSEKKITQCENCGRILFL